MTEKHGRIEHFLNERESIVEDTNDIPPETTRIFDRAIANGERANRKVIARVRKTSIAGTTLGKPVKAKGRASQAPA